MIFSPVYHRKDILDDNFEMLSIITDDNVELEGVVYEPKIFSSTVVFFGGRSQDTVGLIKKLSFYFPTQRIITFNYRSYGKSKGIASEKNIYKDALQVVGLVQKNYGDFYILGFSLGSSVASYVASKVKSSGVFLIGSFDSLASLARAKYVEGRVFPMIDLSKVFRYEFDNKKHVQEIDAKTYLFVSRNDEIAYIHNARNLRDNVKNLQLYKEYDNLHHKELLWNEDVIKIINGVLK